MALTNAQYDKIMRRYDEVRERHRHELLEKEKRIFSEIPEMKALQDKVSEVSVAEARRRILQGKKVSEDYAGKMHFLKERKKQLLLSHGYPANALELTYDCPICKDTGLVDGHRCSCFLHMAAQVLYEESELPAILEEENFSHFSFDWYSDTIMDGSSGKSQRELAEYAVWYAKNFARGVGTSGDNLYIYGKTGVGKTFLTHCIAKDAIDHSASVVCATAGGLFQTLTNTRFHPDAEGLSYERLVLRTDLLVIDDLGTEYLTGPGLEELFRVLNERITGRKSTVISTNLSIEALSRRYDERITSRILDRYKVLKLDANDIRISRQLSKGGQS